MKGEINNIKCQSRKDVEDVYDLKGVCVFKKNRYWY